MEAEGSQCSRDAHCVGARSLFWVVCTVHCALNRLCIVPLLNAQVLQCKLSVDCAENTYSMLHRFGWSIK